MSKLLIPTRAQERALERETLAHGGSAEVTMYEVFGFRGALMRCEFADGTVKTFHEDGLTR